MKAARVQVYDLCVLLAASQATLNQGTASVTEMPLEFCVIICWLNCLDIFHLNMIGWKKTFKITLFSDLLGVLSCGLGTEAIAQN